jgi:uncharacterized protein
MPEPLLVAKARTGLHLLPQFANRHGLSAGATGTGKTVTLQRLKINRVSVTFPASLPLNAAEILH